MTTVAEPAKELAGGESAPKFQQRLGLFDATMLVAGNMIGSGIFIVSASIARDVGSSGWLLAVWVLTGVITVIGALSYAELGAMMPFAGGQYVFLRNALNPLAGFLYGWTLFLVIQTGFIAAVAIAFAKFLGVLAPALGTEHVLYSTTLSVPHFGSWAGQHFQWALTWQPHEWKVSAGQFVAAGVIVVLTVVNCLGVQEGKWVQNLFTLAKTLALVVLIVFGLTVAINPEAIRRNLADLWSGMFYTSSFQTTLSWFSERVSSSPAYYALVTFMVVGATMTGSLFSADAWNNVTFAAGEVKNPRRTLPLSLGMGTSLVIVLYLLANLAYVAVLPVEGTKPTDQNRDTLTAFERGIAYARDDRVGTAVMELAAPRWGTSFMAIAIMISTFGCVNGLILAGARLYYAMARDGLFFQRLGRLNRRGVPAAGLVWQGVWAIVLAYSGTYGDLLDYSVFAALLFYALTVFGLFVLRWRQPQAERPYRAVGYPILPGLYVLLCTLILVDLLVMKPEYPWGSLFIVLTGIPVYLFWRSRARLVNVARS